MNENNLTVLFLVLAFLFKSCADSQNHKETIEKLDNIERKINKI